MFFKKNAEIIVATILFIIMFIFKLDFYEIVLYLLKFMIIIEIVQMLFVFFKKRRIKIRYMIDASLIFFVRELLVITSNHPKVGDVILYVGLIGIFFFFRYLAINVTYKIAES